MYPRNTIAQLIHWPTSSSRRATHRFHSINKSDSRSPQHFDRYCRRIPRSSDHISTGAGRERGHVLPGVLENGRGALHEYFAAPFPLSILSTPFVQLHSSEWGAYAYFSFLTEDTFVIPNLLQNDLEIVRIVVDESDEDVPRLVPLWYTQPPPAC